MATARAVTRAGLGVLMSVLAGASVALAQAAPAPPAAVQEPPPRPRPTPPTRYPATPGLRAGDRTTRRHRAAGRQERQLRHRPDAHGRAETVASDAVPKGTVHEFTLMAAESTVYPTGIARDAGTFGVPDPANPARLEVPTSRPAPWTRKVTVFVPQQYVAGTPAPFIVGADGPDPMLFTTLENLIAQKRIPVMIGISIGNGGGDAQGSQRGLEYDTLSPRYAEFVETGRAAAGRETLQRAPHQGSRGAEPRWGAVPARRPRSAWRGTAPTCTTVCSVTRART